MSVNEQVIRAIFSEFKGQIEKSFSLNEAKFKQLIKLETQKLAQKGVSKEEIFAFVEEIFGGKANFQNGQYKGGLKKEQILAILEEKFLQEQKSTLNKTKELFGGENNFDEKGYKNSWNSQQDLQNIQGKENKAVISATVEEKFGGQEKFSEGVYQPKPEIVKSVLEELKAKGVILNQIHNIFGQEEFYPIEGGEGVPKGREGCRKNAEEIAMMQAQEQKKIRAIEEWDDFFDNKHFISDSAQKKIWMDKFPGNPKAAENVYKEAILKGESIVGEDFTRTEEDQINKAKTPEQIETVLKSIPEERRKKAWEKFFTTHDTLGNIKPEWKENWTKSSLSVEVAKLIYNNGWYNSPNGLINQDKVIENYTTKVLVMGKEHEQSTTHIETLKHLAEEVDKTHEFIVKRVETETNLDKFPSDSEIRDAYNEKKVPDTRSWTEVGKIRDNRIKSLFKQYFQGQNPTSLSDSEIEKWRVDHTGLPNTGSDQRIAYENGWTTPAEIKDGKTSYQKIADIEVLTTKKADIDQEIQKVDNWVQKISSFKHLRELDAVQNQIDKDFVQLKLNLLPPNKVQQITDIVSKQRENLYYSLTDKEDGGMDQSELEQIKAKMKDRTWDAKNYEQVNTKVINAFLKADLGIREMNQSLDEQIKNEKDPQKKQLLESQKLLQPGRGWEDLDQPNEKLYGKDEEGNPRSWIMSKGGYTLPDDVVEFEEKLPKEKRGSALLEFFYDKSRDGKNRPFDPHKYVNSPEASQIFFCLPGKETITYTVMERQGYSITKKPVTKTKTIDVIGGDKGTQGHLAMAAGVGKTTKTISCLLNGGKESVVLVAPLLTLVESAFKHHTSWLPDWGCVFHKKSKRVRVLKGTLKEATQQEIDEGQAEPEPVEIYESHGNYAHLVAKNSLAYWVDEQGNPGGAGIKEGKKGLSILYYGYLNGYIAREKLIKSGAIDEWQPDNTQEWNAEELNKIRTEIKSKLLPKDSIYVFDEAHYNSGAYQALQLKMVQAGYKVLRMSATFPGVPFSTTSTYPKKSYYCGSEIDPKMPGGKMKIANQKHAEALAKHRGVKPETIKWQDENGNLIPVEVSIDERFRFGKTLIFVRDINITPEQDAVFGKKYSCVAFTPAYKDFCETVSYGRQPGAVMLGNFEHQMGLTFEIDTVISTGITEVSNLGKNFTFSDKTTQFNPISSDFQEQGRGGRIQDGLWIIITKETQEIIVEEDVEAAMVKANFDGDITPIKNAEYPFYDIKMLWGGLAHPHRFGKPPAEALIGLKVGDGEEKRVKKGEPLTKIVWRTKAGELPLLKEVGASERPH